jgi:hypothetical protein
MRKLLLLSFLVVYLFGDARAEQAILDPRRGVTGEMLCDVSQIKNLRTNEISKTPQGLDVVHFKVRGSVGEFKVIGINSSFPMKFDRFDDGAYAYLVTDTTGSFAKYRAITFKTNKAGIELVGMLLGNELAYGPCVESRPPAKVGR